MSRERVIEHIYIRGQGDIKVIYDTNKYMFRARVYDEWIEDKLLQNLRSKVKDRVQEIVSAKYKWVPVIEIEESSNWARESQCIVGFELTRYYLAKREDGKWVTCDWDIKEEERPMAGEVYRQDSFKIPSKEESRYDDDTVTYSLLYTEAKWIGLNRLAEAIRELKEKLRDLIGTEKGQEQIAQAGRLILEWKPEKGKSTRKV